jgi:hypothetical protein
MTVAAVLSVLILVHSPLLLPAAMATNRLTVRPYSIVNHIFDKETKKATDVMVIDAETNETMEFYAKIVLSMHLL